MSTVDDLKKQLELILTNIRDLQARLDTLEQKNCQDLMIALTMAQNGAPMMRSSEDSRDVARRGHDISRLKVRLQHLATYEGKVKRQISALTGENFPSASDGGGHGSGEGEDAVAGREAPLAEKHV